MTLDAQLRTRLTSAVDDTTVPPGLADAVLAGGRRRRRRRGAAGLALVTTAVVGGAMLLPQGGPTARDAQVADGGTVTSMVALRWARSLPQGDAPALPFFGAGGLWSEGQRYDVPAEVNRTVAPRAVRGGWLVVVGEDVPDMRLAVLGVDGDLVATLPPSPGGLDNADAVGVAADGTQVAYDGLLVDLPSLDTTEVPHQPESDEQDGYYTALRVIGFTDQGLVYEGAPFVEGLGTTWLLTDDGSATEIAPPTGSHIPDGGPADVALAFDYTDDNSDTCVTSYVLRDDAWSQDGYGCMGRYLGEALTVSPDRRWLVTDDLPDVWNLQDGAWASVDMPRAVGKAQMAAQIGGVVWESDDAFLLPVADTWSATTSSESAFEQHAQVVRCTMSTGTCERAGDEQAIAVTSTMWGTTELRFAGS